MSIKVIRSEPKEMLVRDMKPGTRFKMTEQRTDFADHECVAFRMGETPGFMSMRNHKGNTCEIAGMDIGYKGIPLDPPPTVEGVGLRLTVEELAWLKRSTTCAPLGGKLDGVPQAVCSNVVPLKDHEAAVRKYLESLPE